jgi:hypothetical protein
MNLSIITSISDCPKKGRLHLQFNLKGWEIYYIKNHTMNTRNHTALSLENYYTCIEEKVDGFTNRGPNPGDLIYLVVKIGKISYCGARFLLDEITDYKPWPDSERYVHALSIKEIEFCEPFDVSILSDAGGKYWAVKYMQGAKPIREEKAIHVLDETFRKNQIDELYRFPEEHSEPEIDFTDEIIEDEKEAQN